MPKKRLYLALKGLRSVRGVAGICAVLMTALVANAQTPSAVTDELACRHLLMALADGPQVPSWSARVNRFTGSALSQAQIKIIIQAANTYAANVDRLTTQAVAIHQSLKAKTMMPAAAIPQLRSLDQQREDITTQQLQQLQRDLGQEGWSSLVTFLNDKVKPTITVAQSGN